ncbi:transglutaminase domain-containing protein [Paenibacillus shirakamiensis]|nr:transglutaminase domain-containing protein [Paenibacillus shirakamiensis]
MQHVQDYNLVNLLFIIILLISVLQGVARGASRSAGRLVSLISGGLMTLVSLAMAIPLALWLSPKLQLWLSEIVLPNRDLSQWEQIYYTLITAVREFPLMRFAVVFIVGYWLIRSILGIGAAVFFGRSSMVSRIPQEKDTPSTLISRMTGAGIGAVIGMARCVVIIAGLFIVVTLSPASKFSHYIEASPVYRQGAQTIIEPITGKLIKEKLPVFTRSVEAELNGIMQRKYEIVDAQVPDDIILAAAEVTKKDHTDEEKARALYDWVGTRIAYDHQKVEDYETKQIWHEQTPQNTFDTRKGVCIDYARLFAVMGRSQGLKVKVITGLGYNGQGGYGPHAWNEVYLKESDTWIPIDSTWASSGDWFNPKGFDETHIPEKAI